MFRSTARYEEKERDVQVEVSLDLFEKLCSIVVTEDKRMQTVVAVPSESGATRHRFFRKNKTDIAVNAERFKQETTPGRLADSFRPLSPTPKDRHFDSVATRSARGRERTVSHSCPPPLSRGAERVDLSDQRGIVKQQREQSCPPRYNHDSLESSSKSRRHSANNASGRGLQHPKKSKDLVSKTASRSRIFGSMRKNGKVIPAPTLA